MDSCNRDDGIGYEKSKGILSRFMPEYLKYYTLRQKDKNAFYDLITLYHFALQVTVIENYELNCVDNAFLGKNLDWLYRWQEQCEKVGDKI